jgi:hypothetical protein
MNCASKLNLTLLISAVDVDANGLHGNIPNEIGLLSNLVDLELYYNKLTGSVPSKNWKKWTQ